MMVTITMPRNGKLTNNLALLPLQRANTTRKSQCQTFLPLFQTRHSYYLEFLLSEQPEGRVGCCQALVPLLVMVVDG